jgi:aspartokinase-like uncharacterized kinase
MPSPIAVVKVGGSLYDLPDLGPRLHRWLAQQFTATHVVLVPGGGPLADAIRHLDRRHALGEETAHWLALRALTINAHFLASLLPQACVIADLAALRRTCDQDRLPVLDLYEFARDDEQRPHHLPHRWTVTSDSLAARVAVVLQASHLVLLKSTAIPPDVDWREAGRLGLVDALFAEALRDAPAELKVCAFNLRALET